MDPLSVTASIVGILGAAAKVSSLLITFVQNTKGAPKLAQAVLAEVNGLSAVLSHLQTYLLGTASSSKSRASLILVEQVIVTLAECVTTFSELEDVLGTARLESDLRIMDRVKWAMKESKVADIQARLQRNKASLSLMLTILQWSASPISLLLTLSSFAIQVIDTRYVSKSMEDAESAMLRLCTLVEQVLAKNEEIGLRLRNMDGADSDPVPKLRPDASTTSSRTVSPPPSPPKNMPEDIQRNAFGFAFEEDLLASRVYRRPLFSDSGESLVTSAARTTASSILSALSLTDISNISVLAVPIYAHEISNRARYIFGDFHPEAPAVEGQEAATKPAQHTLKANKWNVFASAVRHQRRAQAAKPDVARKMEPRILGVPLQESIRYANVAISLMNEEGKSYIYGYVPIFVAKIGVFLKEKGQSASNQQVNRFVTNPLHPATDVEDIFSISGSPLRLQPLEAVFDKPPKYGKGFDWSGYTVHDAASILLRFLLQLPESVIPVGHYGAFQIPMKASHEENEYTEDEYTIRALQQLFTLLPPLSRQLLLYLLDLLAVFASKSVINKMTPRRLAAIFQPSLLSPIKAGDDYIEDATSRQLSQDVLVFMIDHQDHFLVGMA